MTGKSPISNLVKKLAVDGYADVKISMQLPSHVHIGITTAGANEFPMALKGLGFLGGVVVKVLLIIDLQRDFCPGGALAVPEGDTIVPLVNKLMREGGYDLKIATLDWHPENHGSFADNHPGKKLFEVIDLEGVPQVLWPRHCVQGTVGAEFHPHFDAHALNYIVKKGLRPLVDSYSGFFDNQKRGSTELLDILKSEAARRGEAAEDIELHIVGLALDYCVAFTALDAADLKLKASVVVDATRAVNVSPGDDAASLRKLVERGVEVVESNNLLSEMAREVGGRGRTSEIRL
jgi:nicotinamidase/pyrazinamidase